MTPAPMQRPISVGETITAPNPGAKPTQAEATDAIKRLTYVNSNSIEIASVDELKIASDSQGRWWVSGMAVPVKWPQEDACVVFIYKDGGTWVLYDLGTGIDASELPPEVRDRL